MDALCTSTEPASPSAPYSHGDIAASRAFLLDGLGVADPGPRLVGRSTDEAHVPVGLPCRTHDPELWFAEVPADLDRAKALCTGCPIRQACLAVAVHRAEPTGVWGGHIFEQGRIVPRKRARGRPRKHHREPAVTAASEVSAPEPPTVTSIAPGLRHTTADRMARAAARLDDAEYALRTAHRSHGDAGTDAAVQRLHAAVTEYLIAAGARPAPGADRGRFPGNDELADVPDAV